MEKRKILFVINQFYKGGAESALLNLFQCLLPEKYEVDFIILDHIDLKKSICLIPSIPSWIHVFNASKSELLPVFVKKVFFKLYQKATGKQLFRHSALHYVRRREYDAAISFGEWFSSAFVAAAVHAKRKYQWIHADIDKASFLHPDVIRYQQYFDRFIFVSEKSRQAAAKRFPFLESKSLVAHNLINLQEVLKKSSEKTFFPFPPDGLPVLVTVANVRSEKNHLRQVEAMKILFQSGIPFHWLNIGSLTNGAQVKAVKQAIKEANLQQYFLLKEATDNPYAYMKMADAVCVLSDHESWSMVITEAKTLGVPVIATKTSGALEQIVDHQTGILCDFSAQDIAEKIKDFFNNPAEQSLIRRNLRNFSCQENVLQQVEPLFSNEKKKILFVFDNINYLSGARNAALAQAKYLAAHADVFLFSVEPCQDERLYRQCSLIDLGDNFTFRSLVHPALEVLKGRQYPKKTKLLRVIYSISKRLGMRIYFLSLLLKGGFCTNFAGMTEFLNSFNAICVVSEASMLRSYVGTLTKAKKIQWIPTDYVSWREHSSWTHEVSKNDTKIYQKFDALVCLSPRLQQRLTDVYPQFAAKILSIPNLIEYEPIMQGSKEALDKAIVVDPKKFNIITIGRMEKEKNYDVLLKAAQALQNHGLSFHWYFVGSGVLFYEIEKLRKCMGLETVVTLTGKMKNPYPLMKRCNLFVLMSEYEGTPVTIDEAKVLELPVLATGVGGIPDQIENGKYGSLLPSDAREAAETLINFCMSKRQSQYSVFTQQACQEYNQVIQEKLLSLFLQT